MRIEQSFSVNRPPEVVFDYLTNPANLAAGRRRRRPSSSSRAAPRSSAHVSASARRAHADGTWSFVADGAETRDLTLSPRESCPASRGYWSRSQSASSHARWPDTTENLRRTLEAGDEAAPSDV